MANTEKENLLKGYRAYLGSIWEMPTKEVSSFIKKWNISIKDSYLIVDCPSMLTIRQIVSYLLIKDGRKNYRVLYSSQVVDAFFAEGEEESIHDLVGEALIVVVSRHEVDNKRRWELLYQLALKRIVGRKPVLILTDHSITNEVGKFEELGMKVMNYKNVDISSNRKNLGEFMRMKKSNNDDL